MPVQIRDLAGSLIYSIYDSKLRYPEGNFKDINEAGSSGEIYAPENNPNYASATGSKIFIRKFQNLAHFLH